MTVDTAKLARRSYAAFRDNDAETLRAIYHPNVVWDLTHWEGYPEQPIEQGHEGIERILRLLHEDIGLLINDPREVIDLGENRVFVEGQMTIRGASSGAEVTGPPFGQVIEFRDGLIARVDNYSELAEGRRAAGLPLKT